MKVLVATDQTQGERVGDFNHSIEGELVTVAVMCRDDRVDPARGLCGCGRSFSGLNSHGATTTAMVTDFAISYAEYVVALQSSLAAQGWPIDDVEELAEVLTEVADSMYEGTVVGRSGDDIVIRSVPEGTPEPYGRPGAVPWATSG